jgi:hypothetical protein
MKNERKYEISFVQFFSYPKKNKANYVMDISKFFFYSKVIFILLNEIKK